MTPPQLKPGWTYVDEIEAPMPTDLARPVRDLFRAWNNVGDDLKLYFIDRHRDEIARKLDPLASGLKVTSGMEGFRRLITEKVTAGQSVGMSNTPGNVAMLRALAMDIGATVEERDGCVTIGPKNQVAPAELAAGAGVAPDAAVKS